MVRRSFRAPVLATTAIVAVAATGLAACGSKSSNSATAKSPPAKVTSSTPTTTAAAAPAATPGHVAVQLSEYKITPAAPSVAGGRVVFDVTNTGKIKHQFTIIRTNKSAATALSKHNPDDDIPGARGEIASLAPGASKSLVIKHLKPGHYALVCALPGHYQSGMHADFTVN